MTIIQNLIKIILAMISRYLLLSSIPLNRHTIWDELEKMFTCLGKNLRETKF